ncbi:MAG: response regulator transcription factor [Verrucomicrobiales bacterium]|nr:response regulator transcription factor [Verrucomicrobiales bacterium]
MGNAPFTVVLADDESAVRKQVRSLLMEEEGVRLVGEASDGPRAIALIREQRPDVAILDFRLPRLSALHVLAELGTRTLPLILFLAHPAEGGANPFPGSTVGWIAKPVTQDRLHAALIQARTHLSDRLARPSRGLAAPEGRLTVKSGSRVMLVDLDSIVYVASDNNCCRIVTPLRTIPVREPLATLASRLPSQRFVRVNRFAVVNGDAVAALEPKSHGDWIVRLRDGSQHVVSRTRRAEVLQRLRIPT